MSKLLLVGLGGFLGSVLRHLATQLVRHWAGRDDFPLGTLAVNVVGCLAVGVLAQVAQERGAFSPETWLFVVVGVLGGFTTFSAFGNETVTLWRDGAGLLTFLNVAGHLVLGLGAVFAGRWLAKMIWG